MPGRRRFFLAAFSVACCLALAPAMSSGAEQPPEQPVTEACQGPSSGKAPRVCGSLNPGSNAKVGYYFAYNLGHDCAGGSRTSPGPELEGEGIEVFDNLTGLEPETVYAYCLVATNEFGETFGEALVFRPPPPPAPQQPPAPQPPKAEECVGVVESEGHPACDTSSEEPAALPLSASLDLPSTPIPGTPDEPARTKLPLAARLKLCASLQPKRRASCRRRARRSYRRTHRGNEEG
jgi:hypothetical protein